MRRGCADTVRDDVLRLGVQSAVSLSVGVPHRIDMLKKSIHCFDILIDINVGHHGVGMSMGLKSVSSSRHYR